MKGNESIFENQSKKTQLFNMYIFVAYLMLRSLSACKYNWHLEFKFRMKNDAFFSKFLKSLNYFKNKNSLETL